MEKSKIQTVRDEFQRIGCYQPFSIDAPLFDVFWGRHFIRVLGKRNMGFDYEILMYLLADLPHGAGEDAFWTHVDKSDLDKIYEEFNRRAVKQAMSDSDPEFEPTPPV